MNKLKFIFVIITAIFALYFTVGRQGSIPAAALLPGSGDRTLVYARAGDAVTLDPAFLQDENSARVSVNIFEGLVQFNPGTTDVSPCLAENWRVSPDGREWTFYLRKKVRFHDGTPFNAEAVRFSVERQMPPRGTPDMAYATFTFAPVDRIVTSDPYTVKFILKYPYAPFLHNLAMPAAAPIVSPAAVQAAGPDFFKKPVGTGPFVFENWGKGGKIVLKANESYWGGSPQPDRLVFKVIKQSRLRALALKLGLVDVIEGIEPSDAKYLEQKGLSVLRRPGADINFLGFYTDKEPFNRQPVRKAVSMAIDTENIVNTLFGGNAFAAKGPLPPGVLGHDEEIRPAPYDPQGAKELLKRSGYADGLKITLITYENTRPYNPAGGKKLAAAVREDLAKAGIDVEIKSYSWEDYKKALFEREGDAFFYGWIGDNGDPDNFLYTLFSSSQSEGGLNAFHYRNKELDRLLIRGQQETEPLLREKLYHRAVREIMLDTPCVFLNHSLFTAAVSPRVKGFVLHEVPLALNSVQKK